MRRTLGISLMAGIIALAIIVGERMSSDAMAVMIGVVFGVAASIPTSLLIALAARGRRRESPYQRNDYQPGGPPQIYVVSPGQPLAGGPGPGQTLSLPQPPPGYPLAEAARRYRVVGEAEYWLEEQESATWE